jgi:single-strand DNA-binding protein
MADLTIEGKLLKKFETEQVSATFKKREFVIETEGQYPQPVKFGVTQDRCVLLDNYQEGQRVKVSFDLRGREWNGKYFVDLNAWRLELAGGPAQPAATKPAAPQGTQAPKQNDVIEVEAVEEQDDLPF